MLDLIKIFKNESRFANKRFGQHFLTNRHLLELIVKTAILDKSKNIVEIGPGCGVLTQLLLETGANVTVIEIDKNMVEFLNKYLFFYSNLKIINDDFLNVDLEQFESPITFIGNLPYNVSVKIVQKCVEIIDKIDLMVFMFQKEVADRISAQPGSKSYSSLSVYCQYYFDIKKIKHFSGGNFWPKTKVMSSILKFEPKKRYFEDKDKEKRFLNFIEKAFTNKRKTLKNNFNEIDNIENILTDYFNKPTIRAEEISLEDFIKLFEIIDEK